MVTNLRQLNEAVEVETSTFPTLSEVMMSIDPSHKFWVVAGLQSGYHQIRIPAVDEWGSSIVAFYHEHSNKPAGRNRLKGPR